MTRQLVVLWVALALGACSSAGDSVVEAQPVSDDDVRLVSGAEVTISDRLKVCRVDADCALVSTGCDGCCQRQAIHRQSVQGFRVSFARACSVYSGGVCDCLPARVTAQCVERTCQAVPSAGAPLIE